MSWTTGRSFERIKFVQRWKGRAFLGIEEPRELPGSALASWDFKKQSVRIDRTKALEEANAKIELRIDELPRDIEVPTDSAGNNVIYHLTVNVKGQTVREDGTLIYHFPATGKRDDWHHAKAFCEVAMTILPPDSRRRRRQAKTEDVPGTSDERYTSMRGRL